MIPDLATAPPTRGRLLDRLPPLATLGPLVALLLAADRPVVAPEFARSLDQRVARRFAGPGR